MRTYILHCHLLTVFVSVLLLTGITCCPQYAEAQTIPKTTIALTVQPGQTIQLIPIGMKAPVVWAITEKATGGSITTAGKYTAPASTGTYHVVGYSKATKAKACVFTVVVKHSNTGELPLGTEQFYKLPGGGVMRMRYVPSGAFAMGSTGQGDDAQFATEEEIPRHTVNISAFWVGKTEVTRGQYKQFMKSGGYTKGDFWSPEGLA